MRVEDKIPGVGVYVWPKEYPKPFVGVCGPCGGDSGLVGWCSECARFASHVYVEPCDKCGSRNIEKFCHNYHSFDGEVACRDCTLYGIAEEMGRDWEEISDADALEVVAEAYKRRWRKQDGENKNG